MDISYNTGVVLLGTMLLGANAGLVGSFAVLRGRALMGDVLAHAALPGLCLAFLWLGRRSLTYMLVGALGSGLVGVLLLTLLRRLTRIKDDAAMGVVLSVMFGLGIVLISVAQSSVVAGSKAGLDSYILGKTAGMLASDVALMAGVSALSLAVISLLFKELRLTSFDPAFARVQGWPAMLLDGLQMALIAVTTVVGLPAVGAVLVAAMLILPGATLRFWTDRLGTMLIGSTILGGAIGASGTLLSAQYSLLPAGPIIILCGTSFFVFSMLCAPRRGLTARIFAEARFRRELQARRLLFALFEREEAAGTIAAWHGLGEIVSSKLGSEAAGRAATGGLVEMRRGPSGAAELRLTSQGRRRAARLVRGERLWSAYLDEFPEQAAAPFAYSLDEVEHAIPLEVRRRLEAELRATGRLPDVDDAPLAAKDAP